MLLHSSADLCSERKITPSIGPGISRSPRKQRGRTARRDGRDIDGREQRILAAICRHDDLASAELYPYLRPSVEAGLLRILKQTPSDFEDLVQETFERIIRTVLGGGFRGRCRLTTWAQAIAANVALDALRRRAVETRYLANLNADVGQVAFGPTSPERRLEARSSLKLVAGVLSRMKPIHAKATVLRHALEYPVDSVARQLGMSTTAAASQIRRAHEELTRRLRLRAAEL